MDSRGSILAALTLLRLKHKRACLQIDAQRHHHAWLDWKGTALPHLLGHHSKARELRGTKGRRDGNVGGVPAPRDHDATDSRMIVPRVERVPASAEIDLEPCAEIHRRWVRRHTDVAEIPRAI